MKILPMAVFAAALPISALASDPLGASQTEYRGSFDAPINYRPNNGEGRLIVRAPGYQEEDRLILPDSKQGKREGVLRLLQGVTNGGHHSTGKLILVEEQD